MVETDRFHQVMICSCWLGLAVLPSSAWALSEAEVGPVAQITLEAETAPRETTGVSAGIVFKDGRTWSGAAGYADEAGTRRLSPPDEMRIGSQTKTYTGTLVLELVDQHRIGLDDALARWLPELEVPNADKITVRHLLDMTSGIPDYLGAPVPKEGGRTVIDDWVAKRGKLVVSGARLVELTNPMQHGPIGTMSYSNTNFLLLGMIAEKAACGSPAKPGCTFVSELQRRVLEPLCAKGFCLAHTSFPTDDRFPATHSDGYARAVDGKLTDQAGTAYPDANTYVGFTTVDPSVPTFAGAMISSATDETVWIRQLATNNASLLSPSMQDKRLTETVPGDVAGIPAKYGLAIYFMRSLLNDAELLGHAGSIYGYTSAAFRRTDTQTDYAANVATFYLTDEFSAPVVVWALDRNVWNAINANGRCSTEASTDTICSGVNVMQKTLVATRGALTLKPSGGSDGTYVPYATPPATPPVKAGKMAVPTIAFYQNGSSGIELHQAARLTVEPGAALSMTGNRSSAVMLSGNANKVEVAGTVTTTGVGVSGIRDQGTGNQMTIKGAVTGSAVWWDPDLPAVVPSTYVVARPDDTSSAVLVSGNGNKMAANVTIDGLVRTQRLGTAAVRVLPGSRDYRLVVGRTGRIIGPVVMQGEGASLEIEPGGKALYVAESIEVLAPNPSGTREEALRDSDVPGVVPRDVLRGRPFRSLGAPGMPSISRDAVLTSRTFARPAPGGRETGGPRTSTGTDERVPAVVVSLTGSRNAVTVGGAIVGAIPKDADTAYTNNLVAVNEAGVQNTVSVERTGLIIGDVVISGIKPRLTVDGTIKGNVTIKDPSVVIAGSGTITGTLTIADKPADRNGSLKIDGGPH